MHNNFFFLRQLSNCLLQKLQGGVVSECFSQNKDELVLRFEITIGSFYIRANMQSQFSALNFPDSYNRARKNSVDLFTPLLGQRVLGITQFDNERSFGIVFTGNFLLIFKMHGNRSNVVLCQEERVIEIFKSNLRADYNIIPTDLNKTIDWSYENFVHHHDNLSKVYFTFGKVVWDHLEKTNFASHSVEEKWRVIQDVLNQLNSPKYFVTEINESVRLSLLKLGNIKEEHTDPVRAANDFFYTFINHHAFVSERQAALSSLHQKLTSAESYLSKALAKLEELERENHYKVWADLIMANLHEIKQGDAQVILSDFYNENSPRTIKLKRDFSPQRNAEVYYRKGKNQSIEIDHLRKVISNKQQEIEQVSENLYKISNAATLKELRSVLSQFSNNPKNEKQSVATVPYHEFVVGGFKVLVGKNAAANDELTLKHSYKEDLWLHAKDVTGSHVLIKYQAGKKFPKDVIEKAAQLAAYNSKRKTQSLCPVIVTPKKFVRKRKGDPAGAVVVEREEVIMVTPSLTVD